MTTGSLTTDARSPISAEKNQGSGWVGDGSFLQGSWRRRVWSGGDTPPDPRTRRYETRSYTTLSKRGKVIKRKFKIPLDPGIRKKRLIPLPYDTTRIVNSPGSGPLYYKNVADGSQGWYRGRPWGNTGVSDGYSQFSLMSISLEDEYRLLTKLQNNIKGSDFNCAIFLGEGREALDLIANSALRVGHAYRYLRKGDVVRAATTLVPSGNRGRVVKVDKSKELSSQWLELEFGWRPLLSDMRSAAQFLAARLHNPVRRRYVAQVERNADKAFLRSVFRNNSSWNPSIDDISNYVRKSIVAYVEEPSPFVLSGITDPASIAWELTPFSFVADWVLPIGDYLSNRSFFGGLKGTFVITTVQQLKARDPKVFGTTFSGWERSTYKLSRVVNTKLNVPMPAVKPFSDIASWRHAADSVALLVQIAKSSDLFLKRAT